MKTVTVIVGRRRRLAGTKSTAMAWQSPAQRRAARRRAKHADWPQPVLNTPAVDLDPMSLVPSWTDVEGEIPGSLIRRPHQL